MNLDTLAIEQPADLCFPSETNANILNVQEGQVIVERYDYTTGNEELYCLYSDGSRSDIDLGTGPDNWVSKEDFSDAKILFDASNSEYGNFLDDDTYSYYEQPRFIVYDIPNSTAGELSFTGRYSALFA